MLDKSPRDATAMQRITCVLQLKLAKALLSFENALMTPVHPQTPLTLPSQCKVETREKLQVLLFTTVCRMGGGLAGEFEFTTDYTYWFNWLCAKAPKVRICHKTFVHDYNFLLI